MRVAQGVAHMAQRQWQHGGRVVLKVDADHRAARVAHHVARKCLAQAGALVVHMGQRVQPLLPQREPGGGVVCTQGPLDGVAQ